MSSSTPVAHADAPPGDRRALLKARTRAAIVAAAAALMDETRGLDFTADALAERADVSRRTVFNHFASVDDVVAAVLADAFHGLLDSLSSDPPRADDPRAAMVADAVGGLRAADLVDPMASLTRGLGLADGCGEDGQTTFDDYGSGVPPHQAMILLRALAAINDTLADQLHRRHPDVDRLDVDLTVASLLSNVVVLHRHWIARTGGGTDAHARDTWGQLLDRSLSLHS